MEKIDHEAEKCIICGKEHVEMSDEHVIPKTLGGHYHIYNVCKECNSKLGQFVDPTITDSVLGQLFRFANNLKGYKGNVPCPFVKDMVLASGEKVRVTNEGGKIVPHIVTQTEKHEDEDKRSFHLIIDRENESEIDKIVQKFYQREDIDPTKVKIEKTYTYNEIKNPELTYEFKIDLKSFKIGLLKIAYEFTCSIISDYVNDSYAKRIAEKLANCDHGNDVEDLEFYGDGFSETIERVFGDFVDFSKPQRHYIILYPYGEKLVCLVKLCNIYSLCFVMSNHNYLEVVRSGIILINDISEPKCEKISLEDLIIKTTRYYHYGVQPEPNQIKDIDVNDYVPEMIDGNFAIFDASDSLIDVRKMMSGVPENWVSFNMKSKPNQLQYYVLPLNLFLHLVPLKKELEPLRVNVKRVISPFEIVKI